MARLSPAYRRYMQSDRWRAAKDAHWRSPFTLKTCVVCGAKRSEKPLDMHHLKYRTGRDGEMRDPRCYELVPACAYPCHRLLITPLSRHRWARWVLLAAAYWLAVAVLGLSWWVSALVVAALLALPRIPETTAMLFLLGFPVRVLRWVVRALR